MSLQDDILDIREALKGNPSKAEAFMRFEARFVEIESAVLEPVATILGGDPFDERGGPWFSNADLKRLAALPSGTKLYAADF